MLGENNPAKRPEVKAKMAGENNPAKRPEVRKKISDSAKKRVLSEETRRKISLSNM